MGLLYKIFTSRQSNKRKNTIYYNIYIDLNARHPATTIDITSPSAVVDHAYTTSTLYTPNWSM